MNSEPAIESVTESVSEVVPEPVSEPVSEPSAEPAVESSPEPAKKVKKVALLNIPPARVRKCIDKRVINRDIDQEIAKYKVHVTRYLAVSKQLETGETEVIRLEERVSEQPTDGAVKKKQLKPRKIKEKRPLTDEEVAALKQELAELEREHDLRQEYVAALTHERVRFSADAAVYLSIVCDVIAMQVVQCGMKNTLANKRKIMQLCHLTGELRSLPIWPLVRNLGCVVEHLATMDKHLVDARVEREIKSALIVAKREWKKKYGVKDTKKPADGKTVDKPADGKPVETTKPVDKPVEVVDPVDRQPDHENSPFAYYIQNVCRNLIATPEFTTLRISSEIKQFVSELLVQFINRFSGQVLLVSHSMNNKTINLVACDRVLESILSDGCPLKQNVELALRDVVDPKAARKIDGVSVPREQLPLVSRWQADTTHEFVGSYFGPLKTLLMQKYEQYKAAKAAAIAAGKKVEDEEEESADETVGADAQPITSE